MNASVRRAALAVAAVSLAAGAGLAAAHPLWPLFALFAFLLAAGLTAVRPCRGLLALPALLPVLNFAPWTGWLIADEFDVLMLAVLAGGYFRIFRDKTELRHAKLFAGLSLAVACLILRGESTGYDIPMNALRVGKSLMWTVFLWPLLEAFWRPEMPARFFRAALLGSVWVVLAILWERAFFPGLLDFRTPYRPVGLFWEMHHGGAALDVYLVLIAPLLSWAWRQTLPPPSRLLLGAFVLAFVYTCLTTFSRGIVFAAAGAAILHGLLHAWQARGRSAAATPGSLSILVLIGVEAFLVCGTDSFMNERLQQTTQDFGGRLAHWERALSALKSPSDFLFGIGLGNFPSRRIQQELGVARPGEFEAVEFTGGTRGARLSGPDLPLKGIALGRYFALSQRIDPVPGGSYWFSVKARSERDARLLARVCASHLLYPSRCGARVLRIAGGAGWQERSVPFFERSLFAETSWRAMGHGVFLVSVLTPGVTVEIAEMKLEAGGGNLLANARFDEGCERWFPQSFSYFSPWHADNLYIELLVETGIVGLAGFLCLVFWTFRRLFRACLAGRPCSAEFLSAGAGVLALGLLVSILDMPRAATLAGFFLGWGAGVRGWRQETGNSKPARYFHPMPVNRR
jgi:hypothetical protein